MNMQGEATHERSQEFFRQFKLRSAPSPARLPARPTARPDGRLRPHLSRPIIHHEPLPSEQIYANTSIMRQTVSAVPPPCDCCDCHAACAVLLVLHSQDEAKEERGPFRAFGLSLLGGGGGARKCRATQDRSVRPSSRRPSLLSFLPSFPRSPSLKQEHSDDDDNDTSIICSGG